MSISVLDNENGECDELIASLKKQECWHKAKMRNVHGTENYRMGYGAGLDGFECDDKQLFGYYDEIYPDYAQGYQDGKRALEINHQVSTRESVG